MRIVADAVVNGEHDAERLITLGTERIAAEPRARLEYLHIVDSSTLAPIDVVKQDATVLAAVWFGDVRLIDNVPLSAGGTIR